METREIKFRAWDSSLKKIRDVRVITWIGSEIRDITFSDGFFKEREAVKDITLLQYTGLKDKNGVELYYNSDLVILEGEDGYWIAVKDDFDIPCFKRTNDSFELIQFSDYFLTLTRKRNAFEVIGNIYENPDFLKEN